MPIPSFMYMDLFNQIRIGRFHRDVDFYAIQLIQNKITAQNNTDPYIDSNTDSLEYTERGKKKKLKHVGR